MTGVGRAIVQALPPKWALMCARLAATHIPIGAQRSGTAGPVYTSDARRVGRIGGCLMNTATLFSSATDEWETPQAFFDKLDSEFCFNLDVAATKLNAKCVAYITADDDALSVPWRGIGFGQSRCWMNPPYSRGLQAKFIRKAAQERLRGVLTVALLPARTDTKVFHEAIYDASTWQPREGVEIRLLPGRLKFGGAANSAPFPSMLVIFRPAPRGRSMWEESEPA